MKVLHIIFLKWVIVSLNALYKLLFKWEKLYVRGNNTVNAKNVAEIPLRAVEFIRNQGYSLEYLYKKMNVLSLLILTIPLRLFMQLGGTDHL